MSDNKRIHRTKAKTFYATITIPIVADSEQEARDTAYAVVKGILEALPPYVEAFGEVDKVEEGEDWIDFRTKS